MRADLGLSSVSWRGDVGASGSRTLLQTRMCPCSDSLSKNLERMWPLGKLVDFWMARKASG